MQKYRGLITGISNEEKPNTPDGWTFYETDTGVAFLKAGGEWKEDKTNPYLKLFTKPKSQPEA